MLKKQIHVGGKYYAKISGNVVPVRVDAIREVFTSSFSYSPSRDVYDVTNLKTGRKTTFRSAQKFRGVVKEEVSQ